MPTKFNQINQSIRYDHLQGYSTKVKDFQPGGNARIYWAQDQEKDLPNAGFPDMRAQLNLAWFSDQILEFYARYTIGSGGSYKHPQEWPKAGKYLRLPRVVRYIIVENFFSHLRSVGHTSDTYDAFKPIFTELEDQLNNKNDSFGHERNLYIRDMNKLDVANIPLNGHPETEQKSNRFIAACTPRTEDIPKKFLGADVLNIVLFAAIDPSYYWPTVFGSSLYGLMKDFDGAFSEATLSFKAFTGSNTDDDISWYRQAHPKFRRLETWLFHHEMVQSRTGHGLPDGPDYWHYDDGGGEMVNGSIGGIIGGNISGASDFASNYDDIGIKYKGQIPSSLVGLVSQHFNL